MFCTRFHGTLCSLVITFGATTLSLSSLHAEDKTAERIPIGVAVFSPLDTNPAAIPVIHNFEFNVLYGYSFGLNGVAIGAGMNAWEKESVGLVIAGLSNQVGGSMMGVQISGLYNSSVDATGVQIAGLFNKAAGSVRGVQVSGALNSAGKSLAGAQLGTVNQADSIQLGAQIGAVNIAGETEGKQVGFANISQDLRGLQIGFVNVAKVVKGMQVGFLNFSSNAGLGQYGIINIDTSNSFRLFAGAGNATQGVFGIRSGSKWFYGSCGLALRKHSDERYDHQVSLVLGTGVQAELSIFNFSLGFNVDAAEQDAKPASLTAGLAVKIVDSIEAYGLWSKGMSHQKGHQDNDYVIGLQYQLKPIGPK